VGAKMTVNSLAIDTQMFGLCCFVITQRIAANIAKLPELMPKR
jgi:hypothetical protein